MADKETYDDYSAELEEVWALFAEDGKEALDAVEETLLALESNPTDVGQIATLFRGLHTFKGNARMMGLEVFESLAHHAEDLVALVRDEGVVLTSGMIDLLLEILDRSRAMWSMRRGVCRTRLLLASDPTETQGVILHVMRFEFSAPKAS